jgi:ferredoxin
MSMPRKMSACFALFFAAMPFLIAQSRFPKPDFSGGYKIPEAGSLPVSATHVERLALLFAPHMQYAALAALLIFLILSCYFLYRQRSRRGIFVMALASIAFFGFLIGGCVCAVGSIQNVAAAIFNPGFPISPVVLGIFMLPLFFALFAGRVFCGSVCPLGTIQDVVNFYPVKVPPPLDRMLRIIPLFYLGAGALFAATGIGFIICRFDPFVGFYRMSGPFFILSAGTALLLIGVFAARPYCRYLCPYGVLLGWLSRLSSRRVPISQDECIRCRRCEDVCPVGAIMPPSPQQEGREPLRKPLRRAILLLMLLPAVTAASGVAGYFLGNQISLLHPKVELYRQVSAELAAAERPQTDESLAFRSSGTPVAELQKEAGGAVSNIRIGSCILGIFLALAIMARLFNFSKRREQKDYQVDNSLCVCCGRCYNVCLRDKRNRIMLKEGDQG